MAKLNEIREFLMELFDKDVLEKAVEEYAFKFDFDREIKKIAYSTNLTPFTINKASDFCADLLMTHHDAWEFLGAQRQYCYKLLNDKKINHCFIHLLLDAAQFGTSASIADALNLENKKFAVLYSGLLVGVAGDIKELPFEKLVKKCETVLCEKVRSFKNNHRNVSRILITTGGGCETRFIDDAANEHCDTYITGEYNMYLQHYAEYKKVNLIIGSHTKTEILGVRSLVDKLSTKFKDIEIFEIIEPSF